jgi:hypothetical protein
MPSSYVKLCEIDISTNALTVLEDIECNNVFGNVGNCLVVSRPYYMAMGVYDRSIYVGQYLPNIRDLLVITVFELKKDNGQLSIYSRDNTTWKLDKKGYVVSQAEVGGAITYTKIIEEFMVTAMAKALANWSSFFTYLYPYTTYNNYLIAPTPKGL